MKLFAHKKTIRYLDYGSYLDSQEERVKLAELCCKELGCELAPVAS